MLERSNLVHRQSPSSPASPAAESTETSAVGPMTPGQAARSGLGGGSLTAFLRRIGVPNRPTCRPKRAAASNAIQDGSRFADVSITPARTTPGKVTPIGPATWMLLATRATTAATASGAEGDGVGSRMRSPVSEPVARRIGAPFTPLPPMSIPTAIRDLAKRT